MMSTFYSPPLSSKPPTHTFPSSHPLLMAPRPPGGPHNALPSMPANKNFTLSTNDPPPLTTLLPTKPRTLTAAKHSDGHAGGTSAAISPPSPLPPLPTTRIVKSTLLPTTPLPTPSQSS